MANENIPSQFFHLKDLPTKAVTLYPARAHVVREILNISLQPGQNEVEIYGLAPTIDEQSLQIEGIGEATITDITINKIPNKDEFEDIHGPPEEFSDEEDSDYADSDDDAQSVKAASEKYKSLVDELDAAQERQASAEQQLFTLDNFGNSASENREKDAHNFANAIKLYNDERQRVYAVHAKAKKDIDQLTKRRDKALWELTKAQNYERRKNREIEKKKEQEKRKRARELEKRREESQRARNELMSFWPSMVYRVVVKLEASIETPGTSRRSSIGSVTLVKGDPGPSDKGIAKENGSAFNVSLSMSYVTSGAYWTPRYDLSISSIQKTASIIYKAEVRNGTAETWKDTKVSLSTSQTNFSGLEDKAPTMHPWRVNLSRYGGSDGLLSDAEIDANQKQRAAAAESKKAAVPNARVAHFQACHSIVGPSERNQLRSQAPQGQSFGSRAPSRPSQAPIAAPVIQAISVNQPAPLARSMSRSTSRSGYLSFKRKKEAALPPPPTGAVASTFALGGASHELEGTPDFDTLTSEVSEPAALDFEESAWEDCGLTATYDLPGTRTLAPSSLARRHKIATLNATSIILSHMAVPKLRAAAFLRAKIKNPSSSVTLIKGSAGITLDGSFLGTMSLQQVSPNQMFTVSLGIDTAIQVSYPKPTLHRSTQGIFTKESAHVFSRSVTITNTKPVPVSLLVLDQVPTSQDERLRIDIAQPRGLTKAGDSVATGSPASDAKKPWGKATAVLKADGEVAWTAEIEKGQVCVLKLEYEAKMPSSDNMANVS